MLWRTIEIFINGEWIPVDRGAIKVGDIFRMFEPHGEVVRDPEGKTEWVAISDSIPTEPEGNFMVKTERWG